MNTQRHTTWSLQPLVEVSLMAVGFWSYRDRSFVLNFSKTFINWNPVLRDEN